MKFIDSNVFAYAFYQNEHTEECQRSLEQGGLTDTFAIAETFHILEKEISREQALRCVKGILKLNIKVVDIDLVILYEAIKNTSRNQLSIFDNIHLECALKNQCETILSFDTDFDAVEVPREEP